MKSTFTPHQDFKVNLIISRGRSGQSHQSLNLTRIQSKGKVFATSAGLKVQTHYVYWVNLGLLIQS